MKSKITEEKAEILSKLYNAHKEVMYFEAKRILNDHSLSEDAVHQAFERIIDKLEKITVEDANITVGFLIIVVRNVAIDMYNKRLKASTKLEYIDNIYNENADSLLAAKTPCDEVVQKEAKNNLLCIINRMPPIYRDVLLLEKLYNYPQKEIAELLNISLSAVKKRAERAKKILAEELRKEELI